jgi:hydroxymethylbilane synthase
MTKPSTPSAAKASPKTARSTKRKVVTSTPGLIRIGTRASELALRQAHMVQRALESVGVHCELVTFKTTGDKRLDEPLSAIGAKGLFTKELEVALAKGKVDCCVHSLKDLPTDSPEGLEIVALLEREDPRDVLVINRVTGAESLDELPAGSRVGTSSLRRRAQLLSIRRDLEVVELRGNVPTRLKKVDEGRVHAAILAAAGLIRLEATQRISAFLSPPAWLGAAGQGAIAVQIRSDDSIARSALANLNHPATAVSVTAERAFLAALEGGCQVPIGASTIRNGDDLVLHGMISDLTGRRILRGSVTVDRSASGKSGEALAQQLRAQGADEILEHLRLRDQLPSPQPE